MVETVFIPQPFFFLSFIFFQTPKTPLHTRKSWRGSSCVCYIYGLVHRCKTMLVKPCPGIMQNSTDINTPPFHVPETPCMIPKPDEQGKRRKRTRNQKANYNNKMNGKSREWVKNQENENAGHVRIMNWMMPDAEGSSRHRSRLVSRWLPLQCFGCQG